ncbi:MAG: NADH-quinone oxidoreductase subunit L [Promicromonosporaceae bacterium]|nr:NADH-quinone oxidoreductase subunit L [Promicromonosporaceae bacterium]
MFGASLAPWVIVVPLLSATLLLLAGRRADRWGHWLAVAASGACLLGGAVMVTGMWRADPAARQALVSWPTSGVAWISAGDLRVPLELRVDQLSVTFVLLVTFVGFLIHLYSVSYMAHDPDRRRFFAYLNLFVAAMLLLVLSDSFVLLFVGWEGVGLASYLLIGFWDRVPANATAGKKAFVMNRIGDMGLLAAMALLFAQGHGLGFGPVLAGASGLGEGTATAVGLCLLLAACGKSAQVPLQAWLGDAMAGPTPVSALIHAATMVTAGVYLVVRSHAIFEAAPAAQLVVAIVGAITLLYGAVVGCAKDDIKKTLAASTMSQIGYMMLAAGLGPIGYAFAIFHLVTHGFFKAGLFLGAGSVMHAMGDSTDMRRFGGLSRLLPVTYVTMGLGWLAILGIPPLSGFWSKDRIIEAAFTGVGLRPWVFGLAALLGAGVTAFYMTRLFFMTFLGRRRFDDDVHPAEGSWLMRLPMIILAAGSVALGWLLTLGGGITGWLAPVLGEPQHQEPVIAAPALLAATLTLVLLGGLLAWWRYLRSAVPVEAPPGNLAVRAARADLYQDNFNETLVAVPGRWLTRGLVRSERGVDGAFGGLGRGVAGAGERLRRVQNGYVRTYAATAIGGLLVLTAIVLSLIGRG